MANVGSVKESIEMLIEASNSAKKVQEDGLLFDALSNIGSSFHRLGKAEQAMKYYDQALEIAERINDPKRKSNALSNIALAYSGMG